MSYVQGHCTIRCLRASRISNCWTIPGSSMSILSIYASARADGEDGEKGAVRQALHERRNLTCGHVQAAKRAGVLLCCKKVSRQQAKI